MDNSTVLEFMLNLRPISKVKFDEPVVLPVDRFDGLIHFLDCEFSLLKAQMIQTFRPVTFTRCTFQEIDFHGAYFFGGFTMDHCTVNGRLNFECGGHNDDGLFVLKDSTFHHLVDFEDCWFTGDVEIEQVAFHEGTNLLGNLQTPVSVTFDSQPRIVDVTGKLDLNTFSVRHKDGG